ncbi:MAG: hypothetical protein ACLP4R_01050 [Solirubrobacteraceae bacterium]
MLEVTTHSPKICQSRRFLVVLLGAAALSIGFPGCGGSGSKSSSTSSTTSTSAQTQPPTTGAATTSSSPGSGVASVRTGPVRGTLRGENHAPVVNRSWRYSVTVTDATGHPLNGTVDIEFAYGGQVVGHDTPPTHPVVDGRWHDSLQFPAEAVGMPLSVQAVVHTRLGSITLDWPIEVRR